MTKAGKSLRPLPLLGVLALALPVLISATPEKLDNPEPAGAARPPETAAPAPIGRAGNFSSQIPWAMGGIEPFPRTLDAGTKVYYHKRLTVRRGATLMEVLSGAGLDRALAHKVITALSKTINPKKIRAGQEIFLAFEKKVFDRRGAPALSEMTMPIEFGKEIVVGFDADNGYRSGVNELPTTALRMYAKGTIRDSLYLAAMDQGVPAGVLNETILLFSFDVDFQREIWPGDGFEIFYERRLTADGEAEEGGKVLAATLVLRGKPLTFFRHETPDGRVEFFTADGKSAKKLLMKTPINGARLTSHYGSRRHPVLGYTRMHKGVDFGAATGTPIFAAGDGVVERASPWGSFGNYLRIRHNGTYTTAYAHMSGYAKGIKAGVRVRQGQVVGYVGATGRVTGPHLHYEILMNGKQVNPLSLKLPNGESLKAGDMALFSDRRARMQAQMGAIQAFYSDSRLADAATGGATAAGD